MQRKITKQQIKLEKMSFLKSLFGQSKPKNEQPAPVASQQQRTPTKTEPEYNPSKFDDFSN